MHRFLLFFLACLLLSACSMNQQSPAVSYYLLDVKPDPVSYDVDAESVELKKVVIPDYLDQTRLVMRGVSQEIIFARYHRWADNLDDSIGRVLSSALNSTSQHYVFVPSCQGCKKISVIIDHFYPTQEGKVILSGTYGIQSSNLETHYQPFYFSTRIEQDGYSESVVKMRDLLEKLADKIAADL